MTNTVVPRALIVEDDHSWQQILSEILSDSGLDVDVADNVEQATVILKENPHRLAVVDLSLSPKDHNNYDGLRVLDAVRRVDPGCQTILLTGFATVELAVTALTDYGATPEADRPAPIRARSAGGASTSSAALRVNESARCCSARRSASSGDAATRASSEARCPGGSDPSASAASSTIPGSPASSE